eukprot:12556562-Alexandrium_andersonii.AAC.1
MHCAVTGKMAQNKYTTHQRTDTIIQTQRWRDADIKTPCVFGPECKHQEPARQEDGERERELAHAGYHQPYRLNEIGIPWFRLDPQASDGKAPQGTAQA